jgi:hypothetical protein
MENILSVDLSSETSPIVQEVRGRDYIEYGTEEWRNLYPQFLIDLYYNSSTHAAIINTTAEMIAGEDIVVEESENLEQFVKLKKFFAEANGKESLHEVIKKLSFDFKLQGAFAIHIIWNKAKTEIAEIYHVPVERVRASRPNAMGVVDCYYVCSDWGNTRTNKPVKIAAFNTKDRTNPSQLLYSGLYSPNMDIYHTPDYLAANNWALVDQRVAEFHLNNISNGFSGSYMISFANGVPTQEERFQIERSLAEKFTGASNSGKFVLTFSDDKTRTPEITPITVSNADKQYLALQELLVQNILTGHRVTSPMLMGIKDSGGGLGSNVDEMNAAFEIYLNTVCIPYQKHLLKTLSKIFEVNGMNLPISFVQAKPITTKFTVEDLKSVLTQDEIRAEFGLKPLSDEELTAEDDNYNLEKDCDCGKNKDSCDKSCYEKTELDAFLETVEDIPEGWELIDEEVVDGEHADFDFEEELNQIAAEKIELATTGVARPDSKSEQDGISKKTYDYYRVRYVYAEDNFLTRKSGKKRDFCKKMLESSKLYRKEDISRMSTKRVNPGWGKGGADTYDIFLYKGGGNCHHFWLRQIYRTELGISVSTKIKDADLVGYTKARSEGFTAKKNDKRVAIAPKRMKNNGFVKKR